MKKFYSLLATAFLAVVAFAQTTITQEGNTVTITYNTAEQTLPDNQGGTFNIGENVPNVYGWQTETDTSAATFNNLFGGWPGTAMTDIGGGVWQASVDLASFYPAGTEIFSLNFIINGNGQTSDLSGADYGFAAFTIENMAVIDVQNNTKNVLAVGGQVYFNTAGTFDVKVFDANGKLIQQNKVVSSVGTTQAINSNAKGIYFVQVTNEEGKTQFLKVLK